MRQHVITSTGPHENYLDGEYVGAFTMDKPFGPHVRKCVCDRCYEEFLAKSKQKCEEYKAKFTPEQDQAYQEFILSLLNDLESNPLPAPIPNPAIGLKVGDRVTVHGNHMTEGRIGTVIELPGPSVKYGGMDAQRTEVLLDATADDEWETIWSDNRQYGWLEFVER